MDQKLRTRGSRRRTRLHRLAYYDALTGLPNRHLFDDRIDHAVARARRTGTSFSLLFIDLDRFKQVNDSLGHSAGDRLLIEVARRLRETTRESDTIARLGGDEFTVILETAPDTGAAAAAARKILAALSAPVPIGDCRLQVSASIGIACFPDDGRSAEEMIRNADTAMYSAKETGRGRLRFYAPKLHAGVSERLELESSLRECLASPDGLALIWQPRVRLADGALVGIAASVQWKHAGGDTAGPSRRIPHTEQCGMSVDIDRRVLEEAASAASPWLQSHNARALRITLDVSPARLRHRDASAETLATLRQHGLQPDQLELRLPENAFAYRDAATAHFVRQLGAFGVRFAAEEIGTGHSGLGHLGQSAIDRMKIAPRFIQDLTTSETDRKIVAALIALGHALGLAAVALGVETEAQRRLLERLGCDEAQGGLFGSPADLDTLWRHWAPLAGPGDGQQS